ncbi:response regulator [Nostoc parmelioides]|uniref:Response regulator n=1 Tax=Nostoc parmelioides FACHB-3921 TaxID=2692909 RepID=A0ABR8BQJ6_9NOSO|nr:response regulator [Nostoc parmelioides FACHB-3921]
MAKTKNHILLCEDSRDTIDLLKLILEIEGYKVEASQNVCEGITKFEKNAPDLLITDLIIPGGNGREIINYIRQKLRLKKFPIIVLSAFADDLKLDSKMFLISKPIQIDLFVKTVKTILSK